MNENSISTLRQKKTSNKLFASEEVVCILKFYLSLYTIHCFYFFPYKIDIGTTAIKSIDEKDMAYRRTLYTTRLN